MWINPDPSTFGAASAPTPGAGPVGATSGTDMTHLAHLFFRATQGTNRKVADELRIGYSWAEVTPQAPPTLSVKQSGVNVLVSWPKFYLDSYSLQSRTNLAMGSWASVTNAVVPGPTDNVVTVSAASNARF